MTTLATGLLELLLPPRCVACDAIGAEPFCSACAVGLEPGGTMEVSPGVLVEAAHAYGGPLAVALFRLKYDRRDTLARPLGAALLAPRVPRDIDVVVPVPLAPGRLRQRGFNPARELARPLRRPVDPLALVRPRDAPPQVGASRATRRAQVAGAFVVARPRAIAGRRVLVLDDVLTTGATLAACAGALLEAGARTVQGLTLARAPLPDDVGRQPD